MQPADRSVGVTFGLNGFIYPLHRWPLRGLRVPARATALVSLTLSILAGFGASRVVRLVRGRLGQWIIVGGLTMAVLIDAWPSLALQPVWKEPPSIYASLPPGAVLAEFPALESEVFNIPSISRLAQGSER
jgi:hypothetical protein